MRIIFWIVGLILCIATVCGAMVFWLGHELAEPYNHGRQNQVVTINRGATTEDILATLRDNGIIKEELPLKIYLKLARIRPVMKAGDYRFQSPISPMGVLSELEKGGTEHTRITVPEGWTRFEIAKAMAAIPALKLKNETEAMTFLTDTSAIKDLDPTATSLEGYLFPDTYFIEADTTPAKLVLHMVKRFRKVYTTELEKDVQNSGLPLHNVVTIASIIETEAKLPEERPIVASVIFNRIRRGMKLSMDCTNLYAVKMAGKFRGDGKVYLSYLNIDSPYNSRTHKGLPPGPVGSPGLSSLSAALHPSSTDYLYYVRNPARNDGAHNFYNNVADFEVGVQALRQWEKDQRKKGLR